MSFIDKVKKAFGSKKEDVESQNNVNDEIIDKPSPNEKARNFRYLDDLIHSGAKEIALHSDIVLGYLEKSEYNNGIRLDVDNMVIDGNGHTIDAKGKARIFLSTGKGIEIQNVTLKNGHSDEGGGAIFNRGELTVTGSTLTENTAKRDGGAIDTFEGMLTVSDCTLTKNASEKSGGAIHSWRNTVTIMKSAFTGNTAENDGGAILHSVGMLTVSDSTLQENTTEKDGGAMRIWSESNITGCALIKNTAKCGGGAIYNSGELTITGSALNENTAGNDGAAIMHDRERLKAFNCHFEHNKSKAGIMSNQDALQVHDCVFISNEAENVIVNEENKANAGIFNGEFKDNNVGESVIFNNAKLCTIAKSAFKNNRSNAIINKSDLTLISPEIKDKGKTILNEKHLLIRNSTDELEERVYGDGMIENEIIPSDEKFGFAYLDEKIHESPTGEIMLEEDITFQDYETDYYEEGIELDIDNLIIDGNGHTIDAKGKTRIFYCTGKNITLKNITLKNGDSLNGGAIYKKGGDLTINDSTFNENSGLSGGAIYNEKGELTINDSTFNQNTVTLSGGAISNEYSDLTVTGSTFNGNNAYSDGGAIYSWERNFKIFDCVFSNNESAKNIIFSFDSLQIYNSDFIANHAPRGIVNYGDLSTLSISNGKFKDNDMDKSVISNDGKLCTIEKSIFENNASPAIANKGELTLIRPKIKDGGKAILNENYILIKKAAEELENKISGDGKVEYADRFEFKKFDFTCLDKKIHESASKEIMLENDFSFENYEIDFYEGGIELDIDDLTIDGNGHTIDAQDKARIFHCTGKNITLKNITLKNGHSHKNHDNPFNSNGGAIRINCNVNLTIENCNFIDNTSEDKSGAIHYRDELSITDCTFYGNAAILGGAIYSSGKLTINDSTLHENTAEKDGGAIHNFNGILTVSDSTLTANSAKHDGGAIRNSGEVNITDSTLTENSANNGGAICNYGELNITGCTITKNSADGGGGAIDNSTNGDLTITESTLAENTAWQGGAIYLYVRSKKYETDNCTFKDNRPGDIFRDLGV